ncbi:MAG TPA: nucleotide sugar dehydrogenase [Candidatus Krumholzibacteria bacterium]|nr:nucleotide sugar dehydrogenase [Candidatus Krumholzibacteria bacterium]
MTFQEKLKDGSARLAVIGLGYVGLPLAVEYAKSGFTVTGIDLDSRKVERLARGESYVGDVKSDTVAQLVAKGRLSATTDFSVLKSCDSVNICVPTPLSKTRDPDISYIDSAVEKIVENLHPGMLIILESTTYPGTTEEVILPRLESTGLKVGEDFYLAFSPERVDPGNPRFSTKNIPKIVGGITPACTETAAALYRASLSQVVPVSSARVAETVKLLENTFRSVNIGLVNEMAQMCSKMDINVWEVIDAAATKPFGFMPFYPGPGLGGHCIPIDPFYLSWKARAHGFEARFIELAGVINSSMPGFVLQLVASALNDRGKAVRGSKILIVGIAYKAGIDDTRESPALDVLQQVSEMGAQTWWYDPHVEKLPLPLDAQRLLEIGAEQLAKYDCAVITTAHADVDHSLFAKHCQSVVDTRNALRGEAFDHLYRL